MNIDLNNSNGVPEQFLARFGERITGILSGFDRLRFLGSIRTLQDARSMRGYLGRVGVLLKEFSAYAQALTERVRQHGFALAEAAGKPVEYLRSSLERKQALAEAAIARTGQQEGLVAVYSCVEPCRAFFVRGDRARKCLVLEAGTGKCLHLYFYFLHALYGLLNLRLQTWFPFTVTVCLNGRRWLARQLTAAGIGFVQQQNCFTQLADVAAAQRLCDAQQSTDWAGLLDGLLATCHPLASELCAPIGQRYYWSLKESEYASDVLFRSPAELAAVYPRLCRHGIEHFGSSDVLRFLGRRQPKPQVSPSFAGELYSTLQRRVEGVRLKHYAHGHSLKRYDKEGSVLRVETTIHHPEVFKVLRTSDARPAERPRWQKMRKAVADTHRRAELSRAANRRYLEGLAQASNQTPTGKVADTVFRPVLKEGRRYRALNPWTENDSALLEAISQGAWILNGLRNRDLRAALFGPDRTPAEQKRDASRTTRLLGLLRAHGLLKKVTGTHRYQVTVRGRQIITALQAARRASIEELTKLAA